MPADPEPAIAARALTKVFRDFWRRPRVTAVEDLDLLVRPGEVFGLLGPNGSGKSTTIKMLLGLLYPTRGTISVLGGSPESRAVRAGLGFLPEESTLYGFLTAEESLDHYGRLFGLDRATRRARAAELLEMVGLEGARRRPVGEMSKGMRRRVGLCQALLHDPRLLVLDEPTSGLDPLGARRVKDLVQALGRRGRTVLLTSHLLADVEDVCDRIAILYGGRKQVEGDVASLLGDPPRTLEAVFLDVVRRAETDRVPTGGVAGAGGLAPFLERRPPGAEAAP